jgi:hypothetical protein
VHGEREHHVRVLLRTAGERSVRAEPESVSHVMHEQPDVAGQEPSVSARFPLVVGAEKPLPQPKPRGEHARRGEEKKRGDAELRERLRQEVREHHRQGRGQRERAQRSRDARAPGRKQAEPESERDGDDGDGGGNEHAPGSSGSRAPLPARILTRRGDGESG